MKFLRFLLMLVSLSSCKKHIKKTWVGIHPIWNLLNEDEQHVPKDTCMITKFGFGQMRFQKAVNQKQISGGLAQCKTVDQKVTFQADDVFITPNYYGIVDGDRFQKTMQTGIKYRFNANQNGLPKVFLEEFIKLERKEVVQQSIFIISKGIQGWLGISTELSKAFEDKKSKKEIVDYYFLCSAEAVRLYNQKIKEGQKVFLFIHTAG